MYQTRKSNQYEQLAQVHSLYAVFGGNVWSALAVETQVCIRAPGTITLSELVTIAIPHVHSGDQTQEAALENQSSTK